MANKQVGPSLPLCSTSCVQGGSGWAIFSPHDCPPSLLQAPGPGHLRWDRAHWESPLGASLVSPGGVDHLLLLYLEGDQVHRKGKRYIVKQPNVSGEGVSCPCSSSQMTQVTRKGAHTEKAGSSDGNRRSTRLVHSEPQS